MSPVERDSRMRFDFWMKADFAEFEGWTAPQIKAFMDGVAKVLAAQSAPIRSAPEKPAMSVAMSDADEGEA